MIRRSWTEISLRTIENNLEIYRRAAGNREIMCVVKADAYGHGDAEVVSRLSNAGIKNYAVSNIAEAVKIREAGAKGRILILGYTPVECADTLIKYDITQALICEEYAERLAGKGVKAQFAIDTGMNRIGLDADNPEECERIIRKYAGAFELTGLFTHLCVADTPAQDEFTRGQIAKFKAVAESVKDLKLECVHCMNTAGGLYHDEYGDLVRLGITLYGLKPDYENTLPDGIKPALTWKSVIAMIKTVHAGETIGYGRTWMAEKDTRIATIPTGYADGYHRSLSNKGYVVIRGIKAPIVGRVCMDQFMVDVTNIPEAAAEDEVILIGEGYTADDMANDCGTIGYEIVCDVTKRVPRVYVDIKNEL